MEAKNKLAQLSIGELQERKKKLTGALIGLGIVMLIAFIILIYLSVKTRNVTLTVVAMGCSTTLLPIFIQFVQLDKELKSRGK